MDDGGQGNVMHEHTSGDLASDLPAALAKPARRALAAASYLRLEPLTTVSAAELLQLHGMGPKALEQLRQALAARDLSFVAAGEGHT